MNESIVQWHQQHYAEVENRRHSDRIVFLISVQGLIDVRLADLGRSGKARLQRTTYISNRVSGYATITHPFHPLSGQRLKILSIKNFDNRDIFSLETKDQSVIAISRDWTDRADPVPHCDGPESTTILSVPHLIELLSLMRILKTKK